MKTEKKDNKQKTTSAVFCLSNKNNYEFERKITCLFTRLLCEVEGSSVLVGMSIQKGEINLDQVHLNNHLLFMITPNLFDDIPFMHN